ncbi:MAG: hypothetical protein AB8W37_12635 [Arsenophonus endosymbiont of Dermacentor nuttalli]
MVFTEKAPNSKIYNKDNQAQLVKVFNSDECHSDSIALAWMIKLYMAENLPKITISKFNDINNQDEFNCLIDNKINRITDLEMRKTINNCFSTLTKA